MSSDNMLSFSKAAILAKEKIDPVNAVGMKYVGLEHIEQESLCLSGHGYAKDVTSAKNTFKKGDILFGKLRPYFRKVVIAPFDGICSTDIWVVRANKDVDQSFLYYWMASKDFVDGATRGSEGTRMPRAKWDYVSGFQSPITDKKEQKAIADILSNLDDKIEINQQMNQTLESIAQTLFKSWFIDFDPVKAKMEGRVPKGMDADLLALFPDSFEDSELEPIPKGWEVKELGHVVKIKQGKYRKDIFIKPEETASTPLWGGNGIRGYISECDLHEPTTFITCRGAGCGFIQKSLEPSSFSNSVIALCNIPNKSVFTFIYNYSLLSNFSAFITGSAQPQITIGNLEKHQLVLPNFKIQQHFNTITEHIYQKILSLDMQIATLAETRDALLPKLLSGELRVNDVEA